MLENWPPPFVPPENCEGCVMQFLLGPTGGDVAAHDLGHRDSQGLPRVGQRGVQPVLRRRGARRNQPLGQRRSGRVIPCGIRGV